MVSKLGLSTRQLIGVVDRAANGENVFFVFEGDLEYYRRLCRHVAWQVRQLRCETEGRAAFLIGRKEGQISFVHFDPDKPAPKREDIVLDHRVSDRLKRSGA